MSAFLATVHWLPTPSAIKGQGRRGRKGAPGPSEQGTQQRGRAGRGRRNRPGEGRMILGTGRSARLPARWHGASAGSEVGRPPKCPPEGPALWPTQALGRARRATPRTRHRRSRAAALWRLAAPFGRAARQGGALRRRARAARAARGARGARGAPIALAPPTAPTSPTARAAPPAP